MPSLAPRSRHVVVALLGATAAGLAGAAAAPAQTPVTSRAAYEVNRIDSPTSAALPDGRVLVGWRNGTNSGDTTLAAVRPAGGVLPPVFQVLRTGITGEDLSFVTGGPAGTPPLASWHDGDSRSPIRARLVGDAFTGQGNVFGGSYSTGRFPRWARCPDGSTVFAYQYTNVAPPAPQSYAPVASLADAEGDLAGGSVSPAATADPFQDPRVTCDEGVRLFAYAIDADGPGTAGGDTLTVRRIGPGAEPLLTRTVPATVGTAAPDARVAPDGRVFAVWSEYDSATATSTGYVASKPGGAAGPLGAPVPLGSGIDVGSLVFDAAGDAHLVTRRFTPPDTSAYSIRTAPAGSTTFGPEQPLLSLSDGFAEVLSDHPDGNPRLLVRRPGPPETYELRGIPQAGSGSGVTGFTVDADGFPTFSFLPGGDLFAAAIDEIGPDQVALREGGLDTGVPPTLDAVSVPGAAAAGEPFGIAVAARDPLGLSAFAWTITGGPAPLTLADQAATVPALAPGTYTATARATDRAGLSSEVSRTFRVVDPAPIGTAPPGQSAPATQPRDATAPRLTAARAVRPRRGRNRNRVAVRLVASEAAAADVELRAGVRRGRERGTLVLRSARVRALSAGRARTVSLRVPVRLARLAGGRLTVRVTLTDAAGNRSARTLRIRRSR